MQPAACAPAMQKQHMLHTASRPNPHPCLALRQVRIQQVLQAAVHAQRRHQHAAALAQQQGGGVDKPLPHCLVGRQAPRQRLADVPAEKSGEADSFNECPFITVQGQWNLPAATTCSTPMCLCLHKHPSASPLPGAGRCLVLQGHIRAVAVHALVHSGVSALADAAAAGGGSGEVRQCVLSSRAAWVSMQQRCAAHCGRPEPSKTAISTSNGCPHLTANSRPHSCSSTSPAEARPAALKPASAAASSSPLRVYTPGHCGGEE